MSANKWERLVQTQSSTGHVLSEVGDAVVLDSVVLDAVVVDAVVLDAVVLDIVILDAVLPEAIGVPSSLPELFLDAQ